MITHFYGSTINSSCYSGCTTASHRVHHNKGKFQSQFS
ncbi:hypothetical protein V6Z11_A05G447600 [Gossypium hirsutum]